MLSPEEIVEQQQLLAAYRRTLAVYLRQQAEIGRAFSPPALINGIDETRRDIKRIKAILQAASAEVAEDPDDDEPPPQATDHHRAHGRRSSRHRPRYNTAGRPPLRLARRATSSKLAGTL